MRTSSALNRTGIQASERCYTAPESLKRYFEDLLDNYDPGQTPCLFLPSMMELSSSLNCTSLDLLRVLMKLRRQGYDYFTLDIYSPITFWHPSKIVR